MGIKGPSEAQIQEAYFQWAALHVRKYPELEALYHVPNGSNKGKAGGAIFKRQGLKAGVPDVCLPVPTANGAGLYLEFKTKIGRVSDSQKEWIERLRRYGHKVEVVRDTDEAINQTLDFLGYERPRK